jgi:hypothetical protein
MGIVSLLVDMHAVGDRLHDGAVGACLEDVLLAAGIVMCTLGRGKVAFGLAAARDAAQLVGLVRLAELVAREAVPIAAAGRVLGSVFAGSAEEDWREEGQR